MANLTLLLSLVFAETTLRVEVQTGLNAPKNPAAGLMGTSPAGICGTPLVACPLLEPAQIVEATVNPPAADTPPFLPVNRPLHPLASLANPPRSLLLLLLAEPLATPLILTAVDLSSTLPAVLLSPR